MGSGCVRSRRHRGRPIRHPSHFQESLERLLPRLVRHQRQVIDLVQRLGRGRAHRTKALEPLDSAALEEPTGVLPAKWTGEGLPSTGSGPIPTGTVPVLRKQRPKTQFRPRLPKHRFGVDSVPRTHGSTPKTKKGETGKPVRGESPRALGMTVRGLSLDGALIGCTRLAGPLTLSAHGHAHALRGSVQRTNRMGKDHRWTVARGGCTGPTAAALSQFEAFWRCFRAARSCFGAWFRG